MKMSLVFLCSLLLLTFSLSSCSNLSKNSVKEGSFLVRNGTAGSQTWNDDLSLTRISWYHELTLQFDLMLGNLTPQSGFNFWFSKTELEEIQKCGDFRVLLAYSLDTKVIPFSHLNEQLELAGYKKIDLIEFKKHLFQHPDSEMNSLRLYQVYGICRPVRDSKPLIFNFPGFTEKTVN